MNLSRFFKFNPWTIIALLMVFAFSLPHALFAADAAPALPTWQELVLQFNIVGVVKFAMGALIGCAMGAPMQAIIEHSLAALVDLLPVWLLPVKTLIKASLPAALAWALARAGMWLGVDPALAYASIPFAATSAHVVNMLPGAADSGKPSNS